jgi:SAM-dependent methyltransferase
MANNIPCIFCKLSETKALYPTYDIFGNNYKILKCNNCQAFFLGPHPDKPTLDKAYGSSYYGEKDEKFFSVFEKVIDFFRRRRAKRVSKFLTNEAKVLDIGCGNGRFLFSLSKYGEYELYGIEMDGNSANRAKRIAKINLKIGELKHNDFPTSTFDAITMYHVFEHLTEPKETIEIINKILKKNGIFVVSFPNITSLQSKLFKGKWFHLDPPRHLLFFDPNDFSLLLGQYNFELVNLTYFSTEQNPFGMVQSILNMFNKKREILFELFKSNSEYTKNTSKINLFLQFAFFIISFPVFIITDIFAGIIKKGATVEFIFKKVSD